MIERDEPLTPIEDAAARGELPEWARVSGTRRAHMERVAALLEGWATVLDLGTDERLRWRATGLLHDALREADPASLRDDLAPEDRDLPAGVVHGPAAAARLRSQIPARVVNAIRYHTIGSPDLEELGRSLYLADFLEPERPDPDGWREALRARMPADRKNVLLEVVAARLEFLIQRRSPIRPETAAFWSRIVTEAKT